MDLKQETLKGEVCNFCNIFSQFGLVLVEGQKYTLHL